MIIVLIFTFFTFRSHKAVSAELVIQPRTTKFATEIVMPDTTLTGVGKGKHV